MPMQLQGKSRCGTVHFAVACDTLPNLNFQVSIGIEMVSSILHPVLND
jgi:hypothetical protein